MNPLSTLKIAKDIIKHEENWCQDYYAQDINNKFVEPLSDSACRWCVLGAVIKACSNEFENGCDGELHPCVQEAYKYLEISSQDIFEVPASIANDLYGHEAILNLYNYAIELAEDDEC